MSNEAIKNLSCPACHQRAVLFQILKFLTFFFHSTEKEKKLQLKFEYSKKSNYIIIINNYNNQL